VATAPERVSAPPDAQPDAQPGAQVTAGPDAVSDDVIRAKRPARVPRAREEDEPAEPGDAAEYPATDTVADAGLAPNGDAMPPLAASVPPAQPASQGTSQGVVRAEAPAASDEQAVPRAAAEAGQDEYLDDGLSWPLPPTIIVGGRYRVEAVISAAASQSGENVYRAKDLQGYERCWSCGTAYRVEAGQVPEQFCPECGADMLGRPYILRERLVMGDEGAAGGDPDGSGLGSAAREEEMPALPGERVFRQGHRRFSVEPEEAELPPFPHGAHVAIASASDIGRERAAGQNEDSVGQLVLQIVTESRAEPLALGIVADGLGGHASGREASRTVVRTVLEHVAREVALPQAAPDAAAPAKDALKQVLREAIGAANAALHAANDESKRDMGSTVVAALIYDETAFVANVGDSRASVLDGGTLRRLTSDHSLVEQLVAGGMIEPEERYTHPNRNQIFRSLGAGADLDNLGIDLFTQRLRPGMRLLLCSDGLWEMVHDEELARILRETANPQAACDALVRAANEHGGEDNISALVVEIDG
jgi:serine/threonine protein phosphatase PrpC/predicted RNA-binding Zn-ribbon protein involved in translation (DUF1610 family)